MIRRTLLEWRSLRYGEGEQQIPDWAADRLIEVAKGSSLAGRNGGNILEHGRHELRARQVVGVIVADGCALEILPKIDGDEATSGADEQSQLRQKLVHMLAVARDLDIDAGKVTDLRWQRETLLEILISLFSRKLLEALRQGMPRRYVRCEDDLPVLRGKLDVTRQFSRLAASPQRLACQYDDLSPDIPLNQIMKAAIERLLRVSCNTENQRRLSELRFAYADISSIDPGAVRWTDVSLDRTNDRWRDLLGLARLLLGERFQTSSMGGQQGFSLLFEMHSLFEEYVGQLLKRVLAGSGVTVSLQGGRQFCLKDDADRGSFQTKPDILLKRGREVLHIIDTKWKRIAPRIDDPKQGVSQADVYQMMAYGQVYGCERLSLLYPHHGALDQTPGVLASRAVVRSGAATLQIASVELGNRRSVMEQLRKLVAVFTPPVLHGPATAVRGVGES